MKVGDLVRIKQSNSQKLVDTVALVLNSNEGLVGCGANVKIQITSTGKTDHYDCRKLEVISESK